MIKSILIALLLTFSINAQSGFYWKWNSPSGGSTPPAGTTDPDTLMFVFGENWNGTDATFTDSVGVTFTKAGTPALLTAQAELNVHNAFDINSTDDFFTFDTLTTTARNYLIFEVHRNTGATSGGAVLDMRSGAGYRLYLAGRHSAGDTHGGWLYGDASFLTTAQNVNDSAFHWKIRCFIFEDSSGLYYRGGVEKIDSDFVAVSLNYTLKLGSTASVSLDIEIAHVSIFALDAGETFSDAFINQTAAYIRNLYDTAATPHYFYWNTITR